MFEKILFLRFDLYRACYLGGVFMVLITGFFYGFPIYVYGLLLLGAVVGAILLLCLTLKWFKVNFSPVVDIFLFGMPLAFFISRLFYVVNNWNFYRENFGEVFLLSGGGTSFYGAAVGFALVFYLVLRKSKLDVFRYADAFALPLIFLLMVLQIGHFAMQTTVGLPLLNIQNDHSLAEYIEYSYRPSGFEMYDYFVPVALYQAMLQLFLFVFVLFFTYRMRKEGFLPNGSLFLFSVIVLALIRFGVGFYYLSFQGAFDMGQLLSLVIALFASVVFYFNIRQAKKDIYFRR